METESLIQPAALSVSDAGTYLGVSSDTIRRLVRRGDLPHARVGNSIRIRRLDLDGYLDNQISRTWSRVDNRGRKAG